MFYKKLKELGENKELDEIVDKYPENIEICKAILKKLKNENVNIEENKESSTTMYLILGNKIFIADLKNNFTRIQTIAHECLHSIQSKKLLWFNFLFSNFFNLFFAVISMLAIFKILPIKTIFLSILLLIGFIQVVVKNYLENDAMTKARFLAKEYMEDVNISSKEEINKIVEQYDKVNDVGIKLVNFQIFASALIKCIIFAVICIIR